MPTSTHIFARIPRAPDVPYRASSRSVPIPEEGLEALLGALDEKGQPGGVVGAARVQGSGERTHDAQRAGVWNSQSFATARSEFEQGWSDLRKRNVATTATHQAGNDVPAVRTVPERQGENPSG